MIVRMGYPKRRDASGSALIPDNEVLSDTEMIRLRRLHIHFRLIQITFHAVYFQIKILQVLTVS